MTLAISKTRARYARDRKGKPIKLRIGEKPVPRAGQKFSKATRRCNELNRYFDDMWGPALPDDDAGLDDAEIYLHHLARRQAIDIETAMNEWLDRRAPWLVDGVRAELIGKVLANPLRFTADTLARRLGVSMTDERRTRLGLRTIGSVDVLRDARLTRRKAKDAEQHAAKRRAAGARSRAEYEAASIRRLKPWLAESISERTWWRHKKRTERHYAADALLPRTAYAVVTIAIAPDGTGLSAA
jgi:hypothetical protein